MGFRIGIDVGGTFTKAALVDDETGRVVARYATLTTHHDERGVATGVVEVFRAVLDNSGVSADDIVFLAHSTTQATNALLEGDVEHVAVLGLAGAAAAELAERQVFVAPIELAPGRWLKTSNRFLRIEQADREAVRGLLDAMAGEGATVVVASAAFGVDNTAAEVLVRTIGMEMGLPTTAGHEITRLYGLSTRTRTAVINASILPRMISTANMTEACVREAGVSAPLMIMRGDGGAMNIDEMRRRPAMTMLSGPAASVAGALMHLKVSDGIYFEVGGTSINLAAIQNGKPNVKHAWVGGHETYVNSVDIRVLGIAGGSLISVEENTIRDVGPRSAHIAGLPYASFATESLAGASIALVGSELADRSYVSLRLPSGGQYALTPTCAANALGLVDVEAYSYGNQAAARDGFSALGRYLGLTADEAATAVLDIAAAKVGPVIEELAKAYALDSDQQLIVGVGGGAGALVPYVARKQGLRFEIAPDAEIISSIGAALAMIREVIERVIPHPNPEDIAAIRAEALEAAVTLGADARSVDVTIELDRQTQLVRATASGAARMKAQRPAVAIAEGEAREVAASSFGVDLSEIVEIAKTSAMRVYGCAGTTSVRVVDWEGRVRLSRREMIVEQTTAAQASRTIASIWSRQRFLDPDENPGFFALYDRHVIDVTHLGSRAQSRALLERELADQPGDAEVVLLAIAGRSSRESDEAERI